MIAPGLQDCDFTEHFGKDEPALFSALEFIVDTFP
jgi:hypothetical protein